MAEPFRCVSCGAASSAATVCDQCGGRSFELARPIVSRSEAELPPPEPISLAQVRAARARRRSANDRD